MVAPKASASYQPTSNTNAVNKKIFEPLLAAEILAEPPQPQKSLARASVFFLLSTSSGTLPVIQRLFGLRTDVTENMVAMGVVAAFLGVFLYIEELLLRAFEKL